MEEVLEGPAEEHLHQVPLCVPCISPVSPLYLPCISPVSPHLPCISLASPFQDDEYSPFVDDSIYAARPDLLREIGYFKEQMSVSHWNSERETERETCCVPPRSDGTTLHCYLVFAISQHCSAFFGIP